MPKSRRRPRQHVNPLSATYACAQAIPEVVPAHLGPAAPVDVELGCADAQFSFALALAHPDRFVLGLDIRRSIIDRGMTRVGREQVGNLRLAYCNLNVDLDRVLAAIEVDRFHLLFPDPWFKAKHKKRRVVERQLVDIMHSRLRPGGELHIASDIFEIAMEAMAEIDGDVPHLFENLNGPWRFCRDNPYGVCSRREEATLGRGQRVWRVIWRRREPQQRVAEARES